MTNLLKYYKGIGKRKTSIAKVILKKGKGIFNINNKLFNINNNYFNYKIILSCFKILNLNILKYNVDIYVKGGGIISQLYAIKLAISKAIYNINYKYKKYLSLSTDSRIKERRKYGLKKARKSSQYSKR